MLNNLSDALEKVLDGIDDDADMITSSIDELLDLEEPAESDFDRLHDNCAANVKDIKEAAEKIRSAAGDFEYSFTEVPMQNGYDEFIYKTDSVAMETIMEEITEIMRVTPPAQFIELLKLLR